MLNCFDCLENFEMKPSLLLYFSILNFFDLTLSGLDLSSLFVSELSFLVLYGVSRFLITLVIHLASHLWINDAFDVRG